MMESVNETPLPDNEISQGVHQIGPHDTLLFPWIGVQLFQIHLYEAQYSYYQGLRWKRHSWVIETGYVYLF